MTNPSDLAGDEMRAPTAEEVKFYAWRGPGYWGPRDQVNTDMVMMAREVERLREAADTIDRLTSMGEAVAWMHPSGAWVDHRYEEVAMHCGKDGPHPVPLYTHASPREGHVEVPASREEGLNEDDWQALLSAVENLRGGGNRDEPTATDTRWRIASNLADIAERLRAALIPTKPEAKEPAIDLALIEATARKINPGRSEDHIKSVALDALTIFRALQSKKPE